MLNSSSHHSNSAINASTIVDKFYTCIHCLTPSNNLYKSYSPPASSTSSTNTNSHVNSIKLTCCSHCQNDVDHYIEREFLLVWIDMVLLRLPAYRHVLFNRFLHFNQQYHLFKQHQLQHPTIIAEDHNKNNNNKKTKKKNKDDTLLHPPAVYSKNTLIIWMLCIIILFKSIITMTLIPHPILFDSYGSTSTTNTIPTTFSTYTINQSFTVIHNNNNNNNNIIPILYFLPPQLRTLLVHSLSPYYYSFPLPSFTSLHTLYLFTIFYSTMEFFTFYIVTILSTKLSIHYVYAPFLHHQYNHHRRRHLRLVNSTNISNRNTKIDTTTNHEVEWNHDLILLVYTPMQNALHSGILLLQSFIYTCAVFCSIYEQYNHHHHHHHHDNPNSTTVHYLGLILNGIYHSFMVYTVIEWFYYNYVRILREKYDDGGDFNHDDGSTDKNGDNDNRNNKNHSIKVFLRPSSWIMLFMVVWICSLGFAFEWLGPRLILRCIHFIINWLVHDKRNL